MQAIKLTFQLAYRKALWLGPSGFWASNEELRALNDNPLFWADVERREELLRKAFDLPKTKQV